jgi:predicted dehydrogenase
MMDEVRWGIVGCGDVTEVKSGPALQEAADSRLVAVMRRNGPLARDYAQRHNVPKWYDCADSLINDLEVNAVYVATPPSTHKEYVLASAAAGKPVYVEKPMGMDYAECEEMIQACEDSSVPLFVAYYRRALPRFMKVKSLLEEGLIGSPRFAEVTFYRPPSELDLAGSENWRTDPVIAGGGYFHDLASHSIDLLQFLLGDALQATGYSVNQAGLYTAPDNVSGIMHLNTGVQVSFTWAFNAFKLLDQTEIIGEKGLIRFSTFEEAPVVLETKSGQEKFDIPNPVHIQGPLIQTVVDALLGKGTCPSTGRSGARTNWVMDQMLNLPFTL